MKGGRRKGRFEVPGMNTLRSSHALHFDRETCDEGGLFSGCSPKASQGLMKKTENCRGRDSSEREGKGREGEEQNRTSGQTAPLANDSVAIPHNTL